VSTRHVIERWLELFNAGDAEGISALYADDAVNHQIALEPVVGRVAIEQFHRDTFAGGPLTCTPTPTAFGVAGSSRCGMGGSSVSGAIGTARNSRQSTPTSTIAESGVRAGRPGA